MALISSAEPEKLFRYADFGLQLDSDLVLQSSRLAVILQDFEAACTEPGFQVNASHLADALRSYGNQCDPLDNWVHQVGKGFKMADWVWRGVHPSSGSVSYTTWTLPAWATWAISLASLLPVIPAWLTRLMLSLPWLKGEYASAPEIPRPLEPAEAKRSGFGELLEQEKPRPASDQWWKDVPLQSQQGLTYGEQKTAYGCTPAATSMILDYWHAKDPTNKTMSAQELLDINAGQRVFTSTGMSASTIHDEVRALGYGVVEDHPGSDRDALQEAVAQGPVIAIVRSDVSIGKSGPVSTLKPGGSTVHAVVVTGISPDHQVRINDPWDGQAHTYSWDEFSASWGANFGKGAPKNSFVEIRPS